MMRNRGGRGRRESPPAGSGRPPATADEDEEDEGADERQRGSRQRHDGGSAAARRIAGADDRRIRQGVVGVADADEEIHSNAGQVDAENRGGGVLVVHVERERERAEDAPGGEHPAGAAGADDVEEDGTLRQKRVGGARGVRGADDHLRHEGHSDQFDVPENYSGLLVGREDLSRTRDHERVLTERGAEADAERVGRAAAQEGHEQSEHHRECGEKRFQHVKEPSLTAFITDAVVGTEVYITTL